MKNAEVNQQLAEDLTCEDPKILEVLMEHIVLHWDDIVELLFDELIHEEVQELNKIEFKKEDNNVIVKQRNSPGKTTLADRSMYGKFHDYKHVDLRDIMSVFDDYLNIEQSI